MSALLGAIAAAAAQELVEFALEKIVESLSTETKELIPDNTYSFGRAAPLYWQAEELIKQANYHDAVNLFVRATEQLRQRERRHRKEIAHIHLCIAEIYIRQNNTKVNADIIVEQCNFALEQLKRRKKKQYLAQIARALNLKCKALTDHAPDKAVKFGLLAYGIEAYCYINGRRVNEYNYNLEQAWIRSSYVEECGFALWRSKTMKELKIGKGIFNSS